LAESLLKISRNLAEARRSDQAAQDQLETWQRRWEAHKTQIAHRLDLIDRQLDLLANAVPPRPQLALVGATHEEEVDAAEFEGAVLRAFDEPR
jgi:hypothetical protein